MADHKPVEVHTVTVDECVPIVEGGEHWNDFHMPCWICNGDSSREEMMYNDFCEMYFHRSCIEKRSKQ